ncbi:MAG: carbohydrate ABC transporter permease [Ruminiclostridium sp.]
MEKNALHPKRGIIFAYMLPTFLIYTFVVILPIISAIRLGFFNWSGGKKITYVGLNNYISLLKDNVFWQSFRNNIIITVLCFIGQIGLAFILASFLQTRIIKWKGLHRVVAYFPATISAVVVGFVWSFVYNYDYGLINTLLRIFNLGGLTKPWLDDPSSIMYVVSIPIIWQYIGFYMVIILAAMSSIEKSIYEMAEIDGANGFQRAVSITLPMIKNTLAVTVMLCISGNMKIFDHIYTMTGGGPGNSSMVMALNVYKTTFIKSQYGYASAMSVAILILSLALILLTRIPTMSWRKESDQ